MKITQSEANRIRQWFNSLQDINPAYLEPGDLILYEKIKEAALSELAADRNNKLSGLLEGEYVEEVANILWANIDVFPRCSKCQEKSYQWKCVGCGHEETPRK